MNTNFHIKILIKFLPSPEQKICQNFNLKISVSQSEKCKMYYYHYDYYYQDREKFLGDGTVVEVEGESIKVVEIIE